MMWAHNNLTELAGGALAADGDVLDGYAQSDGSQHLHFIDQLGHVHELYRSPQPAVQWVDNDLTSLAVEVDTAFFSGVDGYTEFDGSQHVNYIDAAGHVHELYRSPQPAAQWKDNDLHNLASSTQAGSSAVVGYARGDGSQHVHFIDQLGHVHELSRSPQPAAQWEDSDLTTLAAGTPASTPTTGNVLTGYAQPDASQHVHFIDQLGHVHELSRSPQPAAQWEDSDLTTLAAGTPASTTATGNVLTGYAQGDGSQHVHFIDQLGHVHELRKGPQPAAQWEDNDLTKLAGGPLANRLAIAAYAQTDGSRHVNYIDASGHVHELFAGTPA